MRTRFLQSELNGQLEAEFDTQRLALHDPLTGLINRRQFLIELRQLIDVAAASNKSVSAMAIDLDRFKAVNEIYGHAAGDEILLQVSQRLVELIRVGDLVARIGGDEFTVVATWPSDDPTPMTALAQKICEALAAPYTVRGERIEIGASVGVATLNDKHSSELMKHAEQALTRAKNAGRKQVAHFDKALCDEMQRRSKLEQDIRRGLRADEFVPHFHPLIDLPTNRISGFEILARWRHPEQGVVAPDVFIPVAEEVGLISEIGWMVLRKACDAAMRWREPLPMSFNLSPNQFQDPELAEKICEVLRSTGFPPSRLEVEVTESGIIQDFTLAQTTIAALKAQQVRVALDDFGTGYSSLTTLRELPFDKIKLDRSFVTGLQHNDESSRIVCGIVSMAQSLGLMTTAEGVESEYEAEWLKQIGCTQGQGFLYAKPMPAEETARFLDGTAATEPQPVPDMAPPARAAHF
ncbi:MAG: EAL domain-containing protein [Neomegalonema sp.]|nr:EAL domain-containing protein [Neomegalonema sp.]